MKSIKLLMTAAALCGLAACADKYPERFEGIIADASMNTVTVKALTADKTYTLFDDGCRQERSRWGAAAGRPVVVDTGKLEDGAAATESPPTPLRRSHRPVDDARPDRPRGRDGHRDPDQKAQHGRSTWPRWSIRRGSSRARPTKILLKGRESVGNGQTIDFNGNGRDRQGRRGANTPLTIEGRTGTVYTKAE